MQATYYVELCLVQSVKNLHPNNLGLIKWFEISKYSTTAHLYFIEFKLEITIPEEPQIPLLRIIFNN
jgi:hypothetical protein